MDDRSKVLKFADFRWDTVPVRDYKNPDAPYKAVTRQTLLGEGPGEEPCSFLTRYFEIQPGGYSTLERHQHPHAVVVIRGCGRVTLGEESHDLGPFDCVYVSPGVTHQFRATGHEPFGFLCMVDRVRDRPEVVS
jgi:quercetin dioxygenase-like cupin family protein